MAGITIGFGLALMALGVAAFAIAGPVMANITALAFPAGFGLVLFVLGLLARTDKEKMRMHIMHAAVLIGLVGFLVPGAMAGPKLRLLVSEGRYLVKDDQGNEKDKTLAVSVQAGMAAVCLVFVGLCVNSFIQARRRRLAAAGSSPGA